MPQDRRTFLRRAARLAGVSFGGSLLAACAPAAAPAPAPTSAPAAPQAAPAQTGSVTKLTYAFASINPLHYVAAVAGEKPDLAARFGIEIDPLQTTNSPNAVNALVGGSVDVAAVTPDSAWPAQDKVADLKQVMAIADGTPYVLIAQPEIKKAADLKGATFGASAVRGGADTTAIRIMMLENGLKDSDYTVVQAGSVSDRTSAMKARSIQALAQLEPQASLLRDAGFPEIDNANNYPALKGVHSIALLAKQGWYTGSTAETARNFVKAWDAITKWIYDPANKGEVLAITKKTMQVGDAAAQAGYDLHVTGKSVSADLQINEKYMQQFLENQKRLGSEAPLPSDPMKYVDNSLVDAALKS
ncbi:MAG: ABC transporter substrate-binding protein [Chloroflexi bacterium]|nr:ABC transporter substrate-binding protein [Chloroflexota bacterium]